MAADKTVLIIEDEADMVHVLQYNLKKQGYDVLVAGRGDEGLALARSRTPDLILLDLRLPGMSGLNVLREIKTDEATRAIATIIVSALGEEDDVVLGLDLGADDYVAKPFRVRELLARVATALRRAEPGDETDEVITDGDIAVNLSRHEVTVAGGPVELTASEMNIVAHLMRRPGRVFTRRQICDQALHQSYAVQERSIDAHIRTIRRKLGPTGKRIVTVWGVGYKFAEA